MRTSRLVMQVILLVSLSLVAVELPARRQRHVPPASP